MSLQFIAGSSGSGKTRYLYEEIIRESMNHPENWYLVLVPEQYTMQTQKELIRLHPRRGLTNVDVLSFNRLLTGCLKIWQWRRLPCWTIWENLWFCGKWRRIKRGSCITIKDI